MITWGISANSHDAALAVFADEKLAFASHSERFSKVKNDRDLHRDLISYAKIKHGAPDQVIWYERPFIKTLRQFYAGQGWKGRDNDVGIYLARHEIDAPIKYVDHHEAHAAAGYHTSPFGDATVVVIDAIGEFNTLTIWRGRGLKLKKLYSKNFPNSLGLWYSAMTQRIGLKPNEDEYVLMGMAAYGDHKKLYSDMMKDFFQKDKTVKLTQNVHRGCQQWRPDLTVKDSFEIAAATQKIYEDTFEHILQFARNLHPSENLVLMGGCALNCVANRLTGKYFKNTYIYPNPGDAGSAVGAVLAKYPDWAFYTDWNNQFLGYDMGYRSSNDDIVSYLEQHKICGVARGRAEFGPRALGNRSLLADPRGHEIKDKVNEIKHRQFFRPFAPVILEELYHEHFDSPRGWDNSRFMQVVSRCRTPELFPAIVHRDGTSRVQTCPNDGSPFRKLLEEWYDRTGCPMLLNTSLNVKGKPMVNDHGDARIFERQYGVKVFT